MRYCRVVVNMRMLLNMLVTDRDKHIEVTTGLPKDAKFVKILAMNVDVATLLVEHPMFPEAKSETDCPLMTIMFVRKKEEQPRPFPAQPTKK